MKVTKSLLKMVTLSSLLVLGANQIVKAAEVANPASSMTPLQGTLNLSENGGFNPNPPSDLNEKTSINTSYLGISYFPRTISFSDSKLADCIGTQEISMEKNGKSLNIGVKDKRRETDQEWMLTGKITNTLGNETDGISLKIYSTRDTMRNMNDGENDFTEGDLIEQIKKSGVDEVNEKREVTLNTTAQTVMFNQGYFTNGVYDYEISDAKLILPNVDKIKPQAINTTIQWNLEITPNKADLLVETLKDLFVGPPYTQLKDFLTLSQIVNAKKAIDALEEGPEKKVNEEHYNRYVKGYFVQWDHKANNLTRTSETPEDSETPEEYNISTIKYIGSDVKKKGWLRIYRAPDRGPDDPTIGEDTYLSITVKRGNEKIHEYKESGNTNPNTEHLEVWDNLEVGDTIEYTTHNADRLKVFPEDYKQEHTMTYVINEQYKLVPKF